MLVSAVDSVRWPWVGLSKGTSSRTDKPQGHENESALDSGSLGAKPEDALPKEPRNLCILALTQGTNES